MHSDFLNGFLFYSKTLQDHADHIRLRAANFRLKLKKCKFFESQVGYLGYTLDENGTQLDEKKVEAVRHWPKPTTVTGVRSFLGFCSCHRRFVKNFEGIAEPPTNLTKKYQRFNRDEFRSAAFEALMKTLITAPILFHPDYNSPFFVDTDAMQATHSSVSNIIDGIERPLEYASRVLSKSKCQYATTKKH